MLGAIGWLFSLACHHPTREEPTAAAGLVVAEGLVAVVAERRLWASLRWQSAVSVQSHSRGQTGVVRRGWFARVVPGVFCSQARGSGNTAVVVTNAIFRISVIVSTAIFFGYH